MVMGYQKKKEKKKKKNEGTATSCKVQYTCESCRKSSNASDIRCLDDQRLNKTWKASHLS